MIVAEHRGWKIKIHSCRLRYGHGQVHRISASAAIKTNKLGAPSETAFKRAGLSHAQLLQAMEWYSDHGQRLGADPTKLTESFHEFARTRVGRRAPRRRTSVYDVDRRTRARRGPGADERGGGRRHDRARRGAAEHQPERLLGDVALQEPWSRPASASRPPRRRSRASTPTRSNGGSPSATSTSSRA